ncbi:Biofilm regulatory protein A precursor [uncultured Roseburia sp.]|uniref:LCP family protein n=1 Tax=Brotonthovivens ammoniilytica TaxID=2981725 RepID=A0ABT2TLZ1_9FIRM|nr:LCP family protein [Brotonthovivens ammoniilytica]MCU6763234.1 LCP family protein [Brotonthovivens ammoniilytica]SCJ07820.1 Biofilm regulatory protein A precursor [uncultured Roseburia sp.]
MAGHKKKPTKRQRKKRKLILFVIEIVILVVLLGGLFFASKMNLIQKNVLDKDKIGVNEMDKEVQESLKGYTNIAMFGLDNRDMDNYGRGNTDVIMIFSINNDTKEIRMVSVYRDTFLNVSETGDTPYFFKANSAYARGGPERAINMLNTNLDLEIEDYVAFDFSAVAKAVDILGGVEIDIDEVEAEQMQVYVPHTNKILGTDSQVISQPGTYNLDGVQAVAYSRIRYTKGNDFKRAERQREVFSQMMAKAKKADVPTLTKLMDAVFPHISTSLSQGEMLSMIKIMIGYDLGDSQGFPFDRATKEMGTKKGSIVVPCDLVSNVTELHKFLFDNENYTPSSTVEEYSNSIIYETGITSENSITDNFSEVDNFDGSDTGNADSTDSGE